VETDSAANHNYMNSTNSPIATQQIPTQGLRRSPMRAAFQKKPRNPVFFSKMPGKFIFMYVQVQMVRRTTVRKDGKSNSADIAPAALAPSCLARQTILRKSLPINLVPSHKSAMVQRAGFISPSTYCALHDGQPQSVIALLRPGACAPAFRA